MAFYWAHLEKGDIFPGYLYWSNTIVPSIPLSNNILKQPEVLPPKNSVQLYWKKGKESLRHPLVWINSQGKQECAIDINKWIKILQHESYCPEHKKPLRARIPGNYHNISEKIRFAVISTILNIKRFTSCNNSLSPVSEFNSGCEILLGLCNARWTSGIKTPVLVLTHDIETEHGFAWIEKIAKIEEKYGFRSVWNVVPRRYHVNKKILSSLMTSGHEIGLHGIWHNCKEAFLSEQQMSTEFNSLKSFIDEFGIKGYRSPSWFRTKQMFEVLSLFFSYDLSCLDSDPVFPENGGVGFFRPFRFDSGLLELPCSLLFDTPIYWKISPENLVKFWAPKIDFIKYCKGMLLITTHPGPNYLGSNSMLSSYEELLKKLAIENWQSMLPRDLERSLR